MILSASDSTLEARKRQAEDLLSGIAAGLESLRRMLERWSAEDAASAVTARDALTGTLRELRSLTGWEMRLESDNRAWTDREALQDFRRSALADLERLQAYYARLCAGPWRTAADAARDRTVRASVRRFASVLGLCALLLAVWWGWQWSRQQAARAEMDAARRDRAAQAVSLIASAARQAQAVQSKPLALLAPDMSGDCSGIDIRAILPNHPCRQAWDKSSQAVFRAAVPAPGKPVDAPSEVFTDPWGAPYVFVVPSQATPRVVSPGPDGKLGTPDDITADIPY
ncbi:type II secretion system protein GspG [Fundidesulfovibrio terrae]|uniref:type II secretion system protein GspG n=1 Tax=Fundidesulfovibrio terrae TaxID=2922866 RepID=UPI001FAFA04B|nr:type II secretion system protein GspG [Fundidesulfovibrio terrae]